MDNKNEEKIEPHVGNKEDELFKLAAFIPKQ